ncbi:hypothetical protein BJ741DRAFT_624759 [Chytriomyces cf. hyalinus JEL632]|nr:hypothetical protein BJ741DRAFT_624759 [Chytriomyces cf. hyalinus JEL632]
MRYSAVSLVSLLAAVCASAAGVHRVIPGDEATKPHQQQQHLSSNKGLSRFLAAQPARPVANIRPIFAAGEPGTVPSADGGVSAAGNATATSTNGTQGAAAGGPGRARAPLNYAMLVKWNSAPAAWGFMALTVAMTFAVTYNLVYQAKTFHSKAVYVYLLLWCVARITCFALRGATLIGDNGQNYALYQWSSMVAALGFMPLAEAMAVVTVESSAMVYGMRRKTAKMWDLTVKVFFIFFGVCVAGFVFDYTLNKPFGSNVKDYSHLIALREIGFNGLILLTVYTLVGSIFNLVDTVRKMKIPSEFWNRFRMLMAVTIFQSLLILAKLAYTSYRNWNPAELRDEHIWYIVSIVPEYIFMCFYCTHYFLRVFDDIELKHGKYSAEQGKWVKTGQDWEADPSGYKPVPSPSSFK